MKMKIKLLLLNLIMLFIFVFTNNCSNSSSTLNSNGPASNANGSNSSTSLSGPFHLVFYSQNKIFKVNWDQSTPTFSELGLVFQSGQESAAKIQLALDKTNQRVFVYVDSTFPYPSRKGLFSCDLITGCPLVANLPTIIPTDNQVDSFLSGGLTNTGNPILLKSTLAGNFPTTYNSRFYTLTFDLQFPAESPNFAYTAGSLAFYDYVQFYDQRRSTLYYFSGGSQCGGLMSTGQTIISKKLTCTTKVGNHLIGALSDGRILSWGMGDVATSDIILSAIDPDTLVAEDYGHVQLGFMGDTQIRSAAYDPITRILFLAVRNAAGSSMALVKINTISKVGALHPLPDSFQDIVFAIDNSVP